MSESQAVAVQPHADVVWAVVQPARFDEATVDRIQSEVTAAAAQQPGRPVVLDYSNVSFISSLGLGTTMALLRALKQQGQRLILVGLRPDVRSTFAITRLDKLLEIQPGVEDAVNLVRGAAE
jgi:anti-anti-sigma factor